MVGKSNQNVVLIQIDASSFAKFEISEFEISRVDCIVYWFTVSVRLDIEAWISYSAMVRCRGADFIVQTKSKILWWNERGVVENGIMQCQKKFTFSHKNWCCLLVKNVMWDILIINICKITNDITSWRHFICLELVPVLFTVHFFR